MIEEIKIKKFICVKCHHSWYALNKQLNNINYTPKRCSRCNTIYWDGLCFEYEDKDFNLNNLLMSENDINLTKNYNKLKRFKNR